MPGTRASRTVEGETRARRALAVGIALATAFALSACLSLAGLMGGESDGGEPPEAGTNPRDASRDHASSSDSADARRPIDCGTFTHPAASSLMTTFAGSTMAPGWSTGTAQCAQQIDGAAVFRPEGLGDFCLFYTPESYHLTCDSVTVQVPQTTTPAFSVQTVMYIEQATADLDARTNLVLLGGGFVITFNGTQLASVPYDPANDLWWRLRESNGTLFFETSLDGVSFTTRHSLPDPMSFDNVTVTLGAGIWTTPVPVDAGEARFRCYNVPAASCE
jgi:hypothetical protein